LFCYHYGSKLSENYELGLKCLLVLPLLYSCAGNDGKPYEQEIEFNKDWKFLRADIPNGQSPTLNDSSWQMLTLPHDYSIEDLPPWADGKIALAARQPGM
jgi:hypothetical protein